MALKDVVKKIKNPSTDVLIPAIDKVLANRSRTFSKKLIRFQIKKLQESLDKGDMKEFHKNFALLFSYVNAPAIRESGVFHPSSLLSDCPRMYYYILTGVEPSDPGAGQIIPGKLQRIFDMGSYIHLYLQAILLEAGMLDDIEVTIEDEELSIQGHMDGSLAKEIFGGRGVLEIKSINSYGFGKLTRAKPEHVYQASIYAKKFGAKKIIFLYFNKDDCDLKEFVEEVNEDAYRDCEEKIIDIKESVKSKKVPARICLDAYSERATNCQFCSICFSKK